MFSDLLLRRKPAGQPYRSHGVRAAHRDDALAFAAEMLPPDYPGLVDPQSPEQVAAGLIWLMNDRSGEAMRENFLGRFTSNATWKIWPGLFTRGKHLIYDLRFTISLTESVHHAHCKAALNALLCPPLPLQSRRPCAWSCWPSLRKACPQYE